MEFPYRESKMWKSATMIRRLAIESKEYGALGRKKISEYTEIKDYAKNGISWENWPGGGRLYRKQWIQSALKICWYLEYFQSSVLIFQYKYTHTVMHTKYIHAKFGKFGIFNGNNHE